MRTLTHKHTQSLINENYKLHQENAMAREGIKIHSDEVVVKVLKTSIKRNEIIINAPGNLYYEVEEMVVTLEEIAREKNYVIDYVPLKYIRPDTVATTLRNQFDIQSIAFCRPMEHRS